MSAPRPPELHYEADPLLDAVLEGIPESGGLGRERRYEPTPREQSLAIDLVTFLRAVLPLPATIQIGFRYAEGKARASFEYQPRDRSGRIYINAAEVLDHHRLLEVILHEAQHLSDCETGRWDSLTKAERERRALAFVHRMTGPA